MKNIAKEKLLNNELCLGVGLRQSRTVDIGKIMATCDYDWLFIDMEHNSMNIDIASQISVAAQDASPMGLTFNNDGTKMFVIGYGADKVYEYSLDNPADQTVCQTEAITNITFNTTGATGIGTPSNLPTGVTASWSSNVLTISGTPSVAGTYAYSVPLAGGCGTVAAT